ncbi:MAG: dTMP kinase [Alkalilacustris sp.]
MAPSGPGGGVFLTFEGIDGSGKSTQARRLAAALRGLGREVVLTREPGGAPGAEEIRALLVQGAPGRWSAESELLLFNAARRDHLERTIAPALARGAVVICDRFADSTRVYQGLRGPALRAEADRLHATFIGLEPARTFVLDMAPEVAAVRSVRPGGAEDRFEAMGLGFQARLADGFRALAAEFPGRVRLVAADRPEEQVAADILALASEVVA